MFQEINFPKQAFKACDVILFCWVRHFEQILYTWYTLHTGNTVFLNQYVRGLQSSQMGTFGRISALIITVSIHITISAPCTVEMDSYDLL